MSRRYAAICLSHNPAIEVTDPRVGDVETAVASAAAEHGTCDVVVGEYSGGLTAVICPGRRYYPSEETHRVEAGWLRLIALSPEPVRKAAKVGRVGCWEYEAAHRLRDILGVTLPQPPMAVDELVAVDAPDGVKVWTRSGLLTELRRLRALVGDENVPEGWATVPRDEAIRQADEFHAKMAANYDLMVECRDMVHGQLEEQAELLRRFGHDTSELHEAHEQLELATTTVRVIAARMLERLLSP